MQTICAVRRRTLLFLFIVLAWNACSVLSPDEEPQEELDTNRSRWEEASSGRDQYVLHQTVTCFCIVGPFPHQVTVVGDSITAVHNLETGEPLPREQWQMFRSVDALFDMVQNAIDEADSVEVSYHALDGYPAAISIDYITNAVDDEIAVRTELADEAR